MKNVPKKTFKNQNGTFQVSENDQKTIQSLVQPNLIQTKRVSQNFDNFEFFSKNLILAHYRYMKWKTKKMNDPNLPNDSEYVKILDQQNTLKNIFCEILG